ncbi:MAG: hypothetical protein ACRD0U_01490 [Acidimicrobiales bacterium]
MVEEVDTAESRPVGRSMALTVAVAAAVTVAVTGVAFSFVSVPAFLFAQIDPDGYDRAFLREGFLHLALPFGALMGLAGGVGFGIWYRRGGRLPDHRPFED